MHSRALGYVTVTVGSAEGVHAILQLHPGHRAGYLSTGAPEHIEAVHEGNARLSRVEQVKRVVLLDRELSLAEDEITPTLKVKRKNVERKFSALFDRLYEDEGFGLTVEARRR